MMIPPTPPPKISEILFASRSDGRSVMHVYDETGRIVETNTGAREDLLTLAETRYPQILISEIETTPPAA